MLFYPVQYEGEESSKNVFYTGAAPNQQAIPAVNYLMDELGVERWVLAGTDYVYPRTTNKILEQYLIDSGVSASDIMINYTPFGHSDWQTIVSDIKKFGSEGKRQLLYLQLTEMLTYLSTRSLVIKESRQKIFQ